MNVANVELHVWRKPECVDKYGVKQNKCDYVLIGEILCARQYVTRNVAAQLANMQNNIELANFLWHSSDQVEQIDLERNDYFAYTMNGVTYFYKLIGVEPRSAFRFKPGVDMVSFRAFTERVTPRECPHVIRKQYGSDELNNVIPSA